MAGQELAIVKKGQQTVNNYITSVSSFFDGIDELRRASTKGDSAGLTQLCKIVHERGEKLVQCLQVQIVLQHRASESAQEVSGAFRLGLQRTMQLKAECENLKQFIRDMKLADHGLDPNPVLGLPPSSSSREVTHSYRKVNKVAEAPMPRAESYEDFRKLKDIHLSKRTSSYSSGGGSYLRKAKSESDVTIQTLTKKTESLKLDNTRLRVCEKKLIKENVVLNRTCKTLEVERDRAEDRLMIEQTQRDSIEKLRRRNKELEDQLAKLCESQVLREREREKESKREREGTEQKDGGADEPQGEAPSELNEQ